MATQDPIRRATLHPLAGVAVLVMTMGAVSAGEQPNPAQPVPAKTARLSPSLKPRQPIAALTIRPMDLKVLDASAFGDWEQVASATPANPR